jgi:hypothetical protein
VASVIDLYTQLSDMRGLEFGELRNIARNLQAVGMLPKASRQERMRPPEITPKNCATFLIAIAVSRPSGGRVPDKLHARVSRFQDLSRAPDAGSTETLLDYLIATINNFLDEKWIVDKDREFDVRQFIFIIDDTIPQVWLEKLNRHKKDEHGGPIYVRDTFASPNESDEMIDDTAPGTFGLSADAFFMDAEIFYRIRNLLAPREDKSAGTPKGANV